MPFESMIGFDVAVLFRWHCSALLFFYFIYIKMNISTQTREKKKTTTANARFDRFFEDIRNHFSDKIAHLFIAHNYH